MTELLQVIGIRPTGLSPRVAVVGDPLAAERVANRASGAAR